MQIRSRPQAPDAHEPTPQERARAVRSVAHHARDAAELREMLEMLGLDADEGRAPAGDPFAA